MDYPERERWLYAVAHDLKRKFAQLGYADAPPMRIGVGFPSTGARGKRVGECHHSEQSRDKVHEIIISPKMDDSLDVAGTVGHEMVHAYLQKYMPQPIKPHGKEFKKLATALGLTGKMTATIPGEAFKQLVQPVITRVGNYPHGSLDGGCAHKKQTTRLKRAECRGCGYLVRVTREWLAVATPICPNPECRMLGDDMEVEE